MEQKSQKCHLVGGRGQRRNNLDFKVIEVVLCHLELPSLENAVEHSEDVAEPRPTFPAVWQKK